MTKDIKSQNISALRSQCRIPEVVEWYYQYQSELSRKYAFLLKIVEVNIVYSSGTTGRNSQEGFSTFNIAVSGNAYHIRIKLLCDAKLCVIHR